MKYEKMLSRWCNQDWQELNDNPYLAKVRMPSTKKVARWCASEFIRLAYEYGLKTIADATGIRLQTIRQRYKKAVHKVYKKTPLRKKKIQEEPLEHIWQTRDLYFKKLMPFFFNKHWTKKQKVMIKQLIDRKGIKFICDIMGVKKEYIQAQLDYKITWRKSEIRKVIEKYENS